MPCDHVFCASNLCGVSGCQSLLKVDCPFQATSIFASSTGFEALDEVLSSNLVCDLLILGQGHCSFLVIPCMCVYVHMGVSQIYVY